MKYRITGVLALVVVLVVAFWANAFDIDNDENRIHQHLISRQPDAGCDCDKSELCTHLPLVVIDTGGVDIPGAPIRNDKNQIIDYTVASNGEDTIKAKLSVMSNDDSNHHPSDVPDLESDMRIRVRGNSSRTFDKKSYLIRLIEEDESYRDEEMMGMDPHYEWALYGPYLDKSLIRNYMWYNITAEFMGYAPNVRFCEVIINGEYQGLYVMTETITNGVDSRLDISEPIDGTTNTGYLLRLDRGSETDIKNIITFSNHSLRNLIKIDIKYPRSGDLTYEMVDRITKEFSDFEKSLYSYDYDTDDYGYYYDIDVGSFVDYFIINEFTTNYDAGSLSTFVYKDIGGKYKMVIWDFNSACDNYKSTTLEPHHFRMQQEVWYYMLIKDEYFVDHVIDRYKKLRETYLNEEYLINYIDQVVEYLGPAVDRNFDVWGYTFSEPKSQYLVPIERNPKDFDEAVTQIKDFIKERGRWLDDHIEILYQYCHESKVKKFNH